MNTAKRRSVIRMGLWKRSSNKVDANTIDKNHRGAGFVIVPIADDSGLVRGGSGARAVISF